MFHLALSYILREAGGVNIKSLHSGMKYIKLPVPHFGSPLPQSRKAEEDK